MAKPRRKIGSVVLTVLLCLVAIAVVAGLNILRKEGWSGVWARKRSLIEKLHPEAAPLLDEGEKRAGYKRTSQR